MKRALILGIGGQDGSYLAEILLERGYKVHGLCRRTSIPNRQRIAHIRDKLTLYQGDITDVNCIRHLIELYKWSQIYNLADQDDVRASYDNPGYNYQVTGVAVGNLLECVKQSCMGAVVFQPISATIYEGSPAPQGIESKITPQSPYACAKAFALHLCHYYRRVHHLKVNCGIMFNHDSPRRGPGYLLQRIARQAVDVPTGKREAIELYCLDDIVSIGYAGEFMELVYRMMKPKIRSDFLIGTPKTASVKEIAEYALSKISSYAYVVRQLPSPKHTVQRQPLLPPETPYCSELSGPKETVELILSNREEWVY